MHGLVAILFFRVVSGAFCAADDTAANPTERVYALLRLGRIEEAETVIHDGLAVLRDRKKFERAIRMVENAYTRETGKSERKIRTAREELDDYARLRKLIAKKIAALRQRGFPTARMIALDAECEKETARITRSLDELEETVMPCWRRQTEFLWNLFILDEQLPKEHVSKGIRAATRLLEWKNCPNEIAAARQRLHAFYLRLLEYKCRLGPDARARAIDNAVLIGREHEMLDLLRAHIEDNPKDFLTTFIMYRCLFDRAENDAELDQLRRLSRRLRNHYRAHDEIKYALFQLQHVAIYLKYHVKGRLEDPAIGEGWLLHAQKYLLLVEEISGKIILSNDKLNALINSLKKTIEKHLSAAEKENRQKSESTGVPE